MVSGIIPCSQECKWIVYFGETPKCSLVLAFRYFGVSQHILTIGDVEAAINVPVGLHSAYVNHAGTAQGGITLEVPPTQKRLILFWGFRGHSGNAHEPEEEDKHRYAALHECLRVRRVR
jgi:hypothetical protein